MLVALESGARSGCDAYPNPEVVQLAPPYKRITLTGIPVTDDSSHVAVTGTSWTHAGELLIGLVAGSNPQGDQYCHGTATSAQRVFRCRATGACSDLGIDATRAAMDARGNLAFVKSLPQSGLSRILAVRTSDGAETEVLMGSGTTYAWAPG